ncbi:MAG: 3D domain-containing protein [Vicinamibacterales bacterium]
MIARSPKIKVAILCGAVLGFVLIHEISALDSRWVAVTSSDRPTPGSQLQFSATAYCRGKTTAAGTAARRGVAAADPDLLPVGSVVRVEAIEQQYRGIYTVMDTGPKVNGRELDIYIWNCDEAVRFGRRRVRVDVLRLGWNPRASAPRGEVVF